jgi:hypothetical protein
MIETALLGLVCLQEQARRNEGVSKYFVYDLARYIVVQDLLQEHECVPSERYKHAMYN